MRTLYVHVGPAKTGSSAIQHVLQTHDDSIVIYPKVGLTKAGSHHNLVRSFYQDYNRGDAVRIDRDTLMKDIAAAVGKSDRNVLISSEMLPERPDIDQLINAVVGLMGGEVNVELLVVCRDQFSRASSAYNQKVKDVVLCERETPDAFLRRSCKQYCYAHFIRRLRRLEHKVTAINYHPSTTLVGRFLQHVGFPDDKIPPSELRNVSLSPKGLVATLAANNVAETPADRERYFNELRKMPKFFATSVFIFGPEAAAEADKIYELDRKFLRNQFKIEFPPRDVNAGKLGLFLAEPDIMDIRAVTASLGAEGAAIQDFAGQFLRS